MCINPAISQVSPFLYSFNSFVEVQRIIGVLLEWNSKILAVLGFRVFWPSKMFVIKLV